MQSNSRRSAARAHELSDQPRFLNAGNASPFTLDGTRTFIVGLKEVAVIDPGPDVVDHVRALVLAVGSADTVRVILTHGHADHAEAAGRLADALACQVWGPDGVGAVDRVLGDGHSVPTDEGELVAVHTPGHSVEHLCFHWPARSALFAGDMMLGLGDTTWVAEYSGCVADYLGSLDRLRSLDLKVIYPAHGPPLDGPAAAIDRYEAHRRERIRQVESALAGRPHASPEELLGMVYGDSILPGMRQAAARSLAALREYVEGELER